MRAPEAAVWPAEPDVPFGVNVCLVSSCSIEIDADDAHDGGAGTHALAPLENGGIAPEKSPVLAARLPFLDLLGGQFDGIGNRLRAGELLTMGQAAERQCDRDEEAQPHLPSGVESGLVVLSHGTSLDRTRDSLRRAFPGRTAIERRSCAGFMAATHPANMAESDRRLAVLPLIDPADGEARGGLEHRPRNASDRTIA